MKEASAEDDQSISDDDDLWRRINPVWVIYDENRSRPRVTSQAFQNLDGEKLSVLLASTVLKTGRTAQDVVASMPGYSLASISVREARELGQVIVRAPEDGEPAHCHMVGVKKKGRQRALAKAAKWVIPPREAKK